MTLKHHLRGAPPLVSAAQMDSLDPSDGDEIRLWVPTSLSGASASVIWRLAYRLTNPDGTANTSAYKWDFVGGRPMFAQVTPGESFSTSASPSGNWVNISGGTVGPQITVPRLGEYETVFGANIDLSNVSGNEAGVSPEFGAGNGAQEGDAAVQYNQRVTTVSRVTVGVVDPASTITLKYKDANPSDTFTAGRRWLSVRPTRVG